MADKETVIREVVPNVWTFSKPFARQGFIPFGGRSTAIKLSDGGVWVFASTPLTPATQAKIDELGPLKYIVGPDAVHYMFLAEFKKAYPEAKLIGIEEHLSKPSLKDLKFDGVYGKDPADTKYGFEDEIQACFFSGFKMHDLAFNHIASGSLIVADLLFNLPAKEQYSQSKSSGSFPLVGQFSPYTWTHKKLVWSMGADKEAMKRDAKTVAGWNFTRVIPCHGDVIEGTGKQAWEEVYKWYLV